MTTVVVQAHPLLDSYSAALLERVTAGLDAAGGAYAVFRIGEGELARPSDMVDADRLVLVYPTWWGGPPAMLLDWLHRMLGADAFTNVDDLHAVSSLGSSRLVNVVQGQWGREYLARRVLRGCGPTATLHWHALYKIDRRTPEAVTAFLDEVETVFAGLPAA